jgi:hypothetical protein
MYYNNTVEIHMVTVKKKMHYIFKYICYQLSQWQNKKKILINGKICQHQPNCNHLLNYSRSYKFRVTEKLPIMQWFVTNIFELNPFIYMI